MIVKIVGIGQKGDERAGMFLILHLADDLQLLRGYAALESHVVDLPSRVHLDFEPIRQGVDAFRADAVQAAGEFVGALPELAARMQIGQDEFNGRDLEIRMDIDGDAPSVVADGA